MSPGTYPHNLFVENVTFFGKKRENGSLNQYFGCYQEFIDYPDGSFEMAHVGAYEMGEDANAEKFKEKHV